MKCNLHNELLLVVDEERKNTIECQRQLYEASILGINKVRYYFIMNDEERKSDIDKDESIMQDMIDEIEATREVLGMERGDSYGVVWGSLGEESYVCKVDAEGHLIKLKDELFTDYKKRHEEVLNTKKDDIKFFVKQINDKNISVNC